VLKAFPGAEAASLHKNKQGEANGWATVILRTTEAAAAVSGGAAWGFGMRVWWALFGSSFAITAARVTLLGVKGNIGRCFGHVVNSVLLIFDIVLKPGWLSRGCGVLFSGKTDQFFCREGS